MKRKQRASAAAAEVDADEPFQAPLPLEAFSGDICAILTARYGRSAAPHHRHLLASAAAIRSILVDDGLPLTPAAVSALRAACPADPAAASAFASLLAILLPHIPSSPSSLPPASASESASALAAFLSSPDASQLPTGTTRSVVKSLGYLALHLDTAADWGAVAAPLEALLAASVDQRAKVRRCAQESVEKLFAYLEHFGCAKKASSAAIGIFEKHISSVKSPVNLDSDAAVHMLGAVAVLVPYLSKKARKTVFSDAYQLMSPCFSPLTRHVLRLMETLLEHLKAENVESELENLISLVLAYLPYDEKKPDDTIVAALQLMRNCLAKLASHPKLWMETLPSAFEAVSGYLILDRKCSEDIAKLLQDCIDFHINQSILLTNGSQLPRCDVEGLSDASAINSICLSINNILRTCASPTDSILTVVLVLFLKLGENSYVFMKDILLTLSQFAMRIDKEPQLKNVMGYLSSPSPHIVGGAIAALSLLIYNDANFCMEVPNLIPSVLVLLQHKAIEVIKVLVTSLQSDKLLNLQADIMSGILPWSSVTKNHFKGKVVLILEILIRKCGFDSINLVTPEKYKAFVRSVEEGRKGNHNLADGAESVAQEGAYQTPKRRKRVDSNTETGQVQTPSRPLSKSWSSGKKEFFRKGTGKAHWLGGKNQQSKASGGKAIELISNPGPIVEVTKAINHKVATKEPEVKCSTRHKIVGLKHPSNLQDSRSLELQRQHESKGCHLHHPGSSYRAAYVRSWFRILYHKPCSVGPSFFAFHLENFCKSACVWNQSRGNAHCVSCKSIALYSKILACGWIESCDGVLFYTNRSLFPLLLFI